MKSAARNAPSPEVHSVVEDYLMTTCLICCLAELMLTMRVSFGVLDEGVDATVTLQVCGPIVGVRKKKR